MAAASHVGSVRIQRPNHVARLFASCLLMLLVALVVGCEQTQTVSTKVQPKPAQMPSYQQIVEGYNAHSKHFDRLWSRTRVRLTWYDENDKRHSVDGDDSKLIMKLPRDLAFTIGKLGKTGMWIGSNEKYYWMFQLQEDPKSLTFGAYDNLGLPCTRSVNLPVHPQHVPWLLGAVQINPQPAMTPAPVKWDNGRYVIDPPDQPVRLWIDARTMLAKRVQLLDDYGNPAVVADLWGHQRVEMARFSPDRWPLVPTRIEISVPGEKGGARIDLSDMTDGRKEDRINEAAFDLVRLQKALKPDKVESLDAACE